MHYKRKHSKKKTNQSKPNIVWFPFSSGFPSSELLPTSVTPLHKPAGKMLTWNALWVLSDANIAVRHVITSNHFPTTSSFEKTYQEGGGGVWEDISSSFNVFVLHPCKRCGDVKGRTGVTPRHEDENIRLRPLTDLRPQDGNLPLSVFPCQGCCDAVPVFCARRAVEGI